MRWAAPTSCPWDQCSPFCFRIVRNLSQLSMVRLLKVTCRGWWDFINITTYHSLQIVPATALNLASYLYPQWCACQQKHQNTRKYNIITGRALLLKQTYGFVGRKKARWQDTMIHRRRNRGARGALAPSLSRKGGRKEVSAPPLLGSHIISRSR